jgi:hypothetical protein
MMSKRTVVWVPRRIPVSNDEGVATRTGRRALTITGSSTSSDRPEAVEMRNRTSPPVVMPFATATP